MSDSHIILQSTGQALANQTVSYILSCTRVLHFITRAILFVDVRPY